MRPHRRGSLFAVALAAAGLLVSACGFQPVYGDRRGEDVPAEMRDIVVEPIAERVGQIMRYELQQRFDPYSAGGSEAFRLVVSVEERLVGTVVAIDDTATRANLEMIARYTLFEAGTNRGVYNASTRAVTSFNISRSDYATVISERDARERNVIYLADRIATDIAVLFRRGGPRQKPGAS